MPFSGYGPRFAAIMGLPLANATAWAASTSYGAGKVVTYQGATYVAPAAGVPSRATFTPGDWTLLAAAGAQGAQGTQGPQGIQGTQGPAGAAAPLYTGTITGDGTATSFTVTHNLNTKSLVGQVHDPADSDAVVPGVDVLFPTVNTAQVVLNSPLASAATLTVILH